MRILFFGDVVGRAGRNGLMARLPALAARLHPDVTVVNAENAAAGKGVTLKIAQDLLAHGVDVLTTGNHIWNQRALLDQIAQEPRLLRPLNFPAGTPGQGAYVHTLADGRKILVANAMANLFMHTAMDDPFLALEALVRRYALGREVQAIFVDFHGEATSEKMAFGQAFDGRVSAIVGSHTHIPTADAQVLPCGTAYQTDAGMCGDFDSVIGVKKESSIWRFTRKIPGPKMEPAEGEATLCGSLIVTDDQTGLAQAIAPVRIGGRLKESLPEI